MTAVLTDKQNKAILHLHDAVTALGAAASTAHRLSENQSALEIIWSVGLSATLRATVESIPKGKGLAGQAWSKGEIIQTCDLATDQRVGKAARNLDYRSTFAIPVSQDGHLLGVLGLAFDHKRVLDEAEIEDVTVRFKALALSY